MLHEDIRAVGIALGEFAGRVSPDDWRKLSALRDRISTLANQAEGLENLRDTSIAEADAAFPKKPPQVEAKEDAAQPTKSSKKSGKAAAVAVSPRGGLTDSDSGFVG